MVVYGLLAVVAVLVLFVRPGSGEGPEGTILAGETLRGDEIAMTVVDGKLDSFNALASAWCPQHERWVEWFWTPHDGLPVDFEHDGPRFLVKEQAEFTDDKPPTTVAMVLRGELTHDGKAARGSIQATAVRGSSTCEGSVRFSAN